MTASPDSLTNTYSATQASPALAPLRLGLAGLGTVGAGVVDILQQEVKLLQARTGRAIQLTHVAVRDVSKPRACDLSRFDYANAITLNEDTLGLATNPEIDVVLELIGGENGIAYDLVKAALANGKHVVTANKALIAHHGLELAKLAEENNVVLAFEAAVAAGVPILSALRTGIAANRVSRIYGILNGTCNYILSRMYHAGMDMEAVMQEAADKGFLEADPSLDVDGIDAAHKLAILSALSFGTEPDFAAVRTQGIRHISQDDVRYASAFGYRIKLIGEAIYADKTLYQAVFPALVPKSLPLAAVEEGFNAVVAETGALGTVLLQGKGAGSGPTGSAVMADVIAIARGDYFAPFTTPASDLRAAPPMAQDAVSKPFYLHLSVVDKPGALAEVTRVLGAHQVSVKAIDQHELSADGAAKVVVITHAAPVGAMQEAFASLAQLPYCTKKPVLMPIITESIA